MSKGLDVLKELKHWKETNNENGVVWLPLFVVEDIEKALVKAQEQEKALKSIFEKMVNILLLELAENVDEYNERIVRNGLLTEEEFNLLKRYF